MYHHTLEKENSFRPQHEEIIHKSSPRPAGGRTAPARHGTPVSLRTASKIGSTQRGQPTKRAAPNQKASCMTPTSHARPVPAAVDGPELNGKVRKLQSDLINAQEDAEQYRREYERIQEEGRQLYNAYISKCNRLKDIAEKHENLQEEREHLESEREQLLERCGKESEKVEEWKAKYRQQADRFKENFSSYKELKEEYAALKRKLEHDKNEVLRSPGLSSKTIQKINLEYEEKEKALREELRYLEHTTSQQRAQIDEYASEIERHQQRLHALEQQKALLSPSKVSAQTDEMMQLRERNRELEETVKRYEEELRNGNDGMTEEVEEVMQQMERCQQSMEGQMHEISSLRSEVESLRHFEKMATASMKDDEDVGALKRRIAELEAKLNAVVSVKMEDADSSVALEDKLEGVTISNELLREENAALQREVDAITTEKRELQALVCNVRTAHSHLEEQIKLKQQSEQMLHDSMREEVREECQRYEAKVEELSATADALKLQLQEMADREEGLQEMIESAQESEATALARVEEAEAETAHLEKRLEEQVKLNRNLQNDLRLVYKKHKKELSDLAAQYQHEDFPRLYAAAVQERRVAEEKLMKVSELAAEIKAAGEAHCEASEAMRLYAEGLERDKAEVEKNKYHALQQMEEADRTKRQLEQRQQQIEKREAALAELDARAAQAETDRSELSQTLSTVQADLAREVEQSQAALQLLCELDLGAPDALPVVARDVVSECVRLRGLVEFMEEESVIHMETIEKSEEQVLELNGELQERVAEIAELKEEHAKSLSAKDEALTEMEHDIVWRAQLLQESNDRESGTIMALRELRVEMEMASGAFEQERAASQEKITSLEAELGGVKEELERLESEALETASHSQLISTELDAAKSACNQAQERVAELKERLEARQEELEEEQRRKEQLSAELAEKVAALEALRAQFDEKTSQISQLEENTQQLSGTTEEMQEALDQSSAELEEARAEMTAMEEEYAGSVERLEEKCAELEESIVELSSSLESTKKELESAQEESRELRASLEEKSALLEESVRECDMVSAANQEAVERSSQLEKEVTKLELSLTDTTEQLAAIPQLQLLVNKQVNNIEAGRQAEERIRAAKELAEAELALAAIDLRIVESQKEELMLMLETVLDLVSHIPEAAAVLKFADRALIDQKYAEMSIRHDANVRELQNTVQELIRVKQLWHKFKHSSEIRSYVMEQNLIKAETEVESLYQLLLHIRDVLERSEPAMANAPGLRGMYELLVEFTAEAESTVDAEEAADDATAPASAIEAGEGDSDFLTMSGATEIEEGVELDEDNDLLKLLMADDMIPHDAADDVDGDGSE